MKQKFLGGVTVATVLPFSPDLSIDWYSFDRLLDYCAAPASTVAVFVNGHAGESSALTATERVEVIRSARARIRADQSLIAGIVADDTGDAVSQALAARDAGADVLTVFPLPRTATHAPSDDEIAGHVRAIGDASGLPLALFQYPIGSGSAYDTPLLVRLASMPAVVAVKEGSDSMTLYEDNWRALRQSCPQVALLPSNFDWFLAQLAVGADGLLSGLASLIPDPLDRLWNASVRDDLPAMRVVSDELFPLVRAIYAQPRADMYARIKFALWRLGVIGCAVSRTTRAAFAPDQQQRITTALAHAGLTPQTAHAHA